MKKLAFLIIPLVLFFSIVIPAPVYAATFTVNSTIDAVDANPGDGICASATGECTLRAAILEANAFLGDDTITLPAGTYTLAIPGTNKFNSMTGSLDITDMLIISGSGESNTIIDGNNIDRVFFINSGFVVMSDLTITGGNGYAEGDGAALSQLGGGMFTDYGIPTFLENITFTGNTAVVGGGMYVYGTPIEMTGVTLANNTAIGGAGMYIYEQADITITDSLFESNIATTGDGGAMIINGGATTSMSLLRSVSTDRLTPSSASRSSDQNIVPYHENNQVREDSPPALNNQTRTTREDTSYVPMQITVDNVTFNNNRALEGTGGAMAIFNGSPDVTITDSNITDNTSENAGGGLAIYNGTITIERSVIEGNQAVGNLSGFSHGGAMLMAGDETTVVIITASTLSSNISDNTGGAISVFGGSLTFERSLLDNNRASGALSGFGVGGGIHFVANQYSYIRNSTLSRNSAKDQGGGIYNQPVYPGILWIDNSTIAENYTFGPGSLGGGIRNYGTLSIDNSIVANNSAVFAGPDCYANVNIGGHGANIFGNTSGCYGFNTYYNPPYMLLDILNIDPKLGPLSDNGGYTLTYRPIMDSPAIDAANNHYCLSLDQLGRTRPYDGDGDGSATCDIGAYEVTNEANLQLTKGDGTSLPFGINEIISYTLQVTNYGPDYARDLIVTDDLPVQTVFVSASQSCSENAGVVTCVAEQLDVGESVGFNIDVQIISDDPLIDNSATVTSVGGDVDIGNNLGTTQTEVLPISYILISEQQLYNQMVEIIANDPSSLTNINYRIESV
jgi:large repetitive protein